MQIYSTVDLSSRALRIGDRRRLRFSIESDGTLTIRLGDITNTFEKVLARIPKHEVVELAKRILLEVS